MLIWKMKFFLYKRFAKGFVGYVFLNIINPENIRQIELKTKSIRDLDQDINRLAQEIKKLVEFTADVDSRLYRNPDFVSTEECQQAAKNELRVSGIKKAIHLLRKERFKQLIFTLGGY